MYLKIEYAHFFDLILMFLSKIVIKMSLNNAETIKQITWRKLSKTKTIYYNMSTIKLICDKEIKLQWYY